MRYGSTARTPGLPKREAETPPAQRQLGRRSFGTDRDRRTIRGRAKLSKLVDLQEIVLPPGDLEIRLWDGFGITYLQGYTLRKTGSKWSAAFLPAAMPRFAAHDYKVPMSAPKSGWNRFWNALAHEGILTLPDASTLKDDLNGGIIRDGVSYVVEVNKDGVYRTYMYSNPAEHKWPEAKRIVKIAELFYKELPVHRDTARR